MNNALNGYYRLHWQADPPAIVIFLSDQLAQYLDSNDWTDDDTIKNLAEFCDQPLNHDLGLFGEKNFGFSNNCFLHQEKKQLTFNLPKVTSYTDKICSYCENNYEIRQECVRCNGTGYETEWDQAAINDLAANVSLFFHLAKKRKLLNQSLGQSPDQSWIDIDVSVDDEGWQNSIVFQLGNRPYRFVVLAGSRDLEGANQAINRAYNFFHDQKKPILGDARCYIDKNAQLFIDVPITRFSVFSSSPGSRSSVNHNVDCPYNVIILLIGLCAFCDEVCSDILQRYEPDI